MKNTSFALTPYRLIAFFVLIAFSPLRLLASSPEEHRFATYNIRYYLEGNGDTGDKHWNNRAPYVYRMIRDYDFDVVGMQEVTGEESPQLTDLEKAMSEYTMYAIEGLPGDKEYNAILYKTARYELIEQGHFFLNEHPETRGKGWNGTNPRLCVWTHLKDKTSGEEFFFFNTHGNYGPTESGIEGARLIGRKIREIAGQVPTVLVGDFNMHRTEHPEAYRNYASVLYDTYDTNSTECIPTTNPCVSGTATNWEKVTSPTFNCTDFDHIFYDHMTCTHRYFITEDFGRSIPPSDHLPVMGTFVIGTSGHVTRFYASDETSLLSAIQQATIHDTICITAGKIKLTQAVVIDHSLCLIGGWNDTFTQITGKTQLIGAGDGQPVISVPQRWSLELKNIRIDGALSTNKEGGGAVYANGSELKLVHCTFLGCTSDKQGGAVSATTHDLFIDSCFFKHCKTKNAGGALYVGIYSKCYINRSRFRANEAGNGAAISVGNAQTCVVGSSCFWENKSTKTGVLSVKPERSNFRTITAYNCTFLNNSLTITRGIPTITQTFGGSAIYASLSKSTNTLNIGLCTLLGNHTIFNDVTDNVGGGTIFSANLGRCCFVDNILMGNTLTTSTSMQEDGLTLSEDIDLWRNMDNLTSACGQIGDWKTNLPNVIEGKMEDGKYQTKVSTAGAYYLKANKFGSFDMQTLTLAKRNLEKTFSTDLDYDGKTETAITFDVRQNARPVLATMGALEYGGKCELDEEEEREEGETALIHPSATLSAKKIMRNGQMLFVLSQHTYNALGQCVE